MRKPPSFELFGMFVGDIVIMYVALWITLALRYLEIPSQELFMTHAAPFSFLFGAWTIVFYIAGLYEPHTVVLRSKIPALLLNAILASSVVAVIFFYAAPDFGITPKTTLFLDLLVTFALMGVWRVFAVQFVGLRTREAAVLIGSGEETRRLFHAVNDFPLYPMRFITWVDLDKLDGIDFDDEVLVRIFSEEVRVVVIDIENPKVAPILPKFYNLIFSHIRFVDQYRVYEDIFNKIPLSLVGYSWFLENVSSRAHFGYDLLKRAMDITLALLLLIPTLIILPFVALAIWLDDRGPVFYAPLRVGKGNRPITMYKFRTMSVMDDGKRLGENRSVITRVGRVLRSTRIDELPQLWNVLRGDLSLIGPRPEFPNLVELYVAQIPYYNMRHLITPGLSGWAQVHHEKPPQTTEETREKLAYDLYYLKNRSFVLDLKIALKTVKTLLSRTGV